MSQVQTDPLERYFAGLDTKAQTPRQDPLETYFAGLDQAKHAAPALPQIDDNAYSDAAGYEATTPPPPLARAPAPQAPQSFTGNTPPAGTGFQGDQPPNPAAAAALAASGGRGAPVLPQPDYAAMAGRWDALQHPANYGLPPAAPPGPPSPEAQALANEAPWHIRAAAAIAAPFEAAMGGAEQGWRALAAGLQQTYHGSVGGNYEPIQPEEHPITEMVAGTPEEQEQTAAIAAKAPAALRVPAQMLYGTLGAAADPVALASIPAGAAGGSIARAALGPILEGIAGAAGPGIARAAGALIQSSAGVASFAAADAAARQDWRNPGQALKNIAEAAGSGIGPGALFGMLHIAPELAGARAERAANASATEGRQAMTDAQTAYAPVQRDQPTRAANPDIPPTTVTPPGTPGEPDWATGITTKNLRRTAGEIGAHDRSPTREGLIADIQAKRPPAPLTPPVSDLPEWVRGAVESRNAAAEEAGIADRIEELSAQRKTAQEVARALRTDKPTVYAVRSRRGIPSMDTGAEFEEWLRRRSAPAAGQPAAQASPAPTEQVNREAPIGDRAGEQIAPVGPVQNLPSAPTEAGAGVGHQAEPTTAEPPELISGVAVKLDDGTILHTGGSPRPHGTIDIPEGRTVATEGFTTTRGRFVDRQEALDIATRAKQARTEDEAPDAKFGLAAADVEERHAGVRPAARGEFGRHHIERRLTEWFERSGLESATRPGVDLSEGEAEAASGDVLSTSFAGPLPGEVRQIIEDHPELKPMFRANTPLNLHPGGEDSISAVGGIEEYTRRLLDRTVGKASAALDMARRMGQNDPEASFLAWLHDHAPAGKRETHVLDKPERLPDGATFSINGERFRASKEEGMTLLSGGGITTYAEALEAVPIDPGSLRLTGEAPEATSAAARPEPPPGKQEAKEPSPAESAPTSGQTTPLGRGHPAPDKGTQAYQEGPTPTERAAEPQPPRTPSPDSTSTAGEPQTTGIAQRVTEARGTAAEPGQGIGAEESARHGRDLLKAGKDPEAALAEFERTRAVSADAMALARARTEQLSKAAKDAAEEHGPDSPQYRAAFKAETDWVARVKPMQTEWHKAGQAQQGETDIDTGTFHGLQRAYHEATGKTFTPEQAKTAQDTAAKVKEATKAAEEAKQRLYEELSKRVSEAEKERDAAIERAANAEAEKVVERLRAEAAEQKVPPAVRAMARRLREGITHAADSARERIKARGIRLKAGLDPVELADYAIIGADYIVKGAAHLAEWSGKMLAEFGEAIKPHLEEIFKAATARFEQETAGAGDLAAQEARAKPTLQDWAAKVKQRMVEGAKPDAIRVYLRKMALELIRTGTSQREPLIDALQQEMATVIPGIERNRVRDLLSGYGEFRPLDKDSAKARLREISGEAQKLAQLEALQKKEAPKATGVERQPPSDEARALQKQVNQAKKEAGIAPDRAGLLKSALASAKTRAKNTIHDLQTEIDTGERMVQGKPVRLSDPELESLRAQLAALREEHARVFPKEPRSDEQRLAAATAAAERSAKAWDQRLADARAGRFADPKKQRTVSGPELEALRAQAQAAREEFEELKGLDPAQKQREERQANQAYRTRLAQREADVRGAIARGEIGPANPSATLPAESAKTMWDSAKANYIDKGVSNFDDIANGLSTDFGLPVADVRRALAQPKGAQRLTDEMYAAQSRQRQVINSAKQWVGKAATPLPMRAALSTPGMFFALKTLGHSTVGMITHAGPVLAGSPPGSAAFAAYLRNFGRQYKFVANRAYHEMMLRDLERRPNYITAQRAGLGNNVDSVCDDYQRAAGNLLGKIGIPAGARGFDALKFMRQDLFDQAWDKLPASLKTKEMAADIARTANHLTGLGENIAGKGKIGTAADVLLFAPRLEGSRWGLIVGDPALAAKRLLNWRNETPEARHATLAEVKQKAWLAGMYLTYLGINQAMLSALGSGQSVNFTDPSKSDWLSFKVAGHNVGIIGPLLGSIRFLTDLARYPFESRKELHGGEPLGAAGERTMKYLRGKLSPFGKPLADVYTGKDYSGRPMPWSSQLVPKYLRKEGVGPVGWGEYAAQTFLPIPAEDALKEAWKAQGIGQSDIERWLKAIAVGAVSGGTGARVGEDYSVSEKH